MSFVEKISRLARLVLPARSSSEEGVWHYRLFDAHSLTATPGWGPWLELKAEPFLTTQEAVIEMRMFIIMGCRYQLRSPEGVIEGRDFPPGYINDNPESPTEH